jgi:hypothetical protein
MLFRAFRSPFPLFPQSVKPVFIFQAVSGTTQQAAEKSLIPSENAEERTSGPKGPIDSASFMRGLKLPPPSGPTFSAAFQVVP